MTDEMIGWLRSQLDADDASEWPHRPSCQMMRHPAPVAVLGKGYSCDCDVAARWYHGIEANRLILDKHGIIWRDIGWLERDGNELIESYEELPVCVTCVPKHSHFPTRNDVPTGPCLTVRLLASTYSGRRGYRAEWAL